MSETVHVHTRSHSKPAMIYSYIQQYDGQDDERCGEIVANNDIPYLNACCVIHSDTACCNEVVLYSVSFLSSAENISDLCRI